MDHDQQAVVVQFYGSAPAPTAFDTAEQTISDPQPHIRQQAVTVLTALGQEGHSVGRSNPGNVDAIFQRLCVVAATDTVTRLRLQALQALANFHHASTPIKVQALSKKAILRVALPSTAATQQQQQATPPGPQQHAGNNRKQPQQPQRQSDHLAGDAALLDAATGALLHATEDDFPRVRLAAVAAVVSLSSQDHLFADAAGLLLADLVGDQLPAVRLAALQALLDQAAAFQQQKSAQASTIQQQVQTGQSLQHHHHQQQQQPRVADHPHQHQQQQQRAEQPPDAVNVDMEESEALMQQQDSQEGDKGSQALEAASESDAAAQQQQDPAAGSESQQQQRRSSVRKSDLPPWGKDALLAASNALSDAEPAVRQLALQLLQHLPPGNAPDLVIVVGSLAACCQRYPDQHAEQVWGLVNSLSSMRAEMITLTPGKLLPLLGSMLQPPSAAGVVDAAAAAPEAAIQADSTPELQLGAAHSPAAAAAGVIGSAAAADIAMLPQGAQVLAALLLLGVQHRKQGLPSLLKELEKAGLMELPSLQRWRARLCAVQDPQPVG